MGASVSRSSTTIHKEDMDDADDEFLNLDIRKALLSPATHASSQLQNGQHVFDDMIISNAESLVRRMRDAYLVRNRTSTAAPAAGTSRRYSTRTLSPNTSTASVSIRTRSQSPQDEELDEARLRASSLRTRLDSPSPALYSYPSSASDDGSGSDCEVSVFSHEGLSSASASSSGDYETGMQDVDLSGDDDGMGFEGLDVVEQNRRLKARVAQLEEALEGCLGLVSGSGF